MSVAAICTVLPLSAAGVGVHALVLVVCGGSNTHGWPHGARMMDQVTLIYPAPGEVLGQHKLCINSLAPGRRLRLFQAQGGEPGGAGHRGVTGPQRGYRDTLDTLH